MFHSNISKPSRRKFIKTSLKTAAGLSLAAMTTKSYARICGANERIRVGVIGTGCRGRDALMKEFHTCDQEQNAEIVAICDTWKFYRDQTAELVKKWYQKDVKQFVDYKDLLALEDVDAVMIATPDHQHSQMLCNAVEAGKDAYCEKPVAMTIEDLNKVYDTVKKSKHITQIGTQLRSWASFTGCKAFYESGVLGRVTKITQSRNGANPYWYNYIWRAKKMKENEVDWQKFLFNRPYRPFNADQYAAWYGYRDFTSGPIGNLMVHFIDLVHYITGAKYPLSAVTHGGVLCFKDDGRDCPDDIQTILEYPEGFLVSYDSNFCNASGSRTHFYGSEGMMDLSDWSKPTATGAGANNPAKLGKEVKEIPHVQRDLHMLDWLKCLRSRKPANACLLEAGYSQTLAVILADRAWVEGKKMIFDPAKREIRPA